MDRNLMRWSSVFLKPFGKTSNSTRWSVAILIFCISLIFWNCAPKQQIITEYKEVKIPVKCFTTPPKKPEPIKDAVEMNLMILRYAQELEAALRSCNGTF